MNNADNEVIIKSKKSDIAFESFQKKMLGFGAISILIWLFPYFLGLDAEAVADSGLSAMFITFALSWASLCLLIYFTQKAGFENLHWTITSKGITITNNRNGTSVFIATDHISSVSVIKDYTLSIVTINTQQPTALGYLANAREMESVLKDLIYKTDKQKDVRIIETVTDNTEEIIKYKKLLDQGIITQEEFDTKKKQLLNL